LKDASGSRSEDVAVTEKPEGAEEEEGSFAGGEDDRARLRFIVSDIYSDLMQLKKGRGFVKAW
jgi:hypothetical protein